MRALILSALMVSIPCAAQPVSSAPWMTGADLLRKVTFRPGVKNSFDLTPEQYVEAERARAYIDGVHDMTEGKSWCYSERYHPGPDALVDDILAGLRKLSLQQLQRNAGDLIAEIWARKWPCPNRENPR